MQRLAVRAANPVMMRFRRRAESRARQSGLNPVCSNDEVILMRSKTAPAAPSYGARLNVYATRPLAAAVAAGAARNLMSINSYCRQALLRQLRSDGVELETNEAA
jgi:hypothetical protein